jgi:hypothetical protein
MPADRLSLELAGVGCPRCNKTYLNLDGPEPRPPRRCHTCHIPVYRTQNTTVSHKVSTATGSVLSARLCTANHMVVTVLEFGGSGAPGAG